MQVPPPFVSSNQRFSYTSFLSISLHSFLSSTSLSFFLMRGHRHVTALPCSTRRRAVRSAPPLLHPSASHTVGATALPYPSRRRAAQPPHYRIRRTVEQGGDEGGGELLPRRWMGSSAVVDPAPLLMAVVGHGGSPRSSCPPFPSSCTLFSVCPCPVATGGAGACLCGC
jgi:hypothetical protein